ncbi:MAG TPA: prephenate dehydratase domain-containing protein [Candidatus Paceibacterota bacterium]|nr:prephenate dehydratase domain-containing protein [Candidatus Paceibacterota bacterium]
MSIPEHRKAIDKLDARIVRLLNERTRHALAIGGFKLAAGEEIYAPHRERAVFDRVCRLNTGPITDSQLRAIYREIMSSALALEKKLTIAYPGPEAALAHQAAVQKFGSSLKYTAQKTIADVFAEVGNNRANYGVVPVENSDEGAVSRTLDRFVESELKIISQIILPAWQCLMVPPGGSRSNIRKVLEQDIRNDGADVARFLVLGRQSSPPTGDDRTSLMVSVADKTGAAQPALAVFHRHKIRVMRIVSRPGRRKASEHLVFIDCNGHVRDRKVASAIAQLEREGCRVKVLGSYPNSD